MPHAFRAKDLGIYVGMDMSALTASGLKEEGSNTYKIAFRDAIEAHLTVPLYTWASLSAGATVMLDMDPPTGIVLENNVRKVLDYQINADKTASSKLDEGAAIGKCCEWTKHGWRKCRTFQLLDDASNLCSHEVVKLYETAVPITLPAPVKSELEALQIHAIVSWIVEPY